MDAHTEHLVLRRLHHLSENRTVFTIAHRLGTVRDADLVVVLRDGRIAETGTPDVLLDRADSLFASLAQAQTLRLG